jgi:HEAT repeat protein
MAPNDIEVLFCDLCGTSVPLSDLERGTALRHQAKTIGACCLPVLRGGDSPLVTASAAAPATPTDPGAALPTRPAGQGGDGRALTLGVVLLFAVAAATIFLDQRLAGLEQNLRDHADAVQHNQRSDSEVLQGIGVAMDNSMRRADFEVFVERTAAAERAHQLEQEQTRTQLASIDRVLGALQQETRQLSAVAVDYRPLFDEVRQQLHRLSASLTEVRSAPAAAPVAPVAPPAGVGPAADTGALPEALAAQVRRLAATDAAVRFEALAALIDSKNPAVGKHVLPMTKDADAFVRSLAVEGLRDFRQADAVEALLGALSDKEPQVANTAWKSLQKLTGQTFPFDANTPNREVRQRALQRWLDWWEKNKATFGS